MAQGQSYKARGCVLRKTKLAEKDLIVTILDESGALIRAVAKGARKPGGSFAAKLELFSVVDALIARGRSLDVITEARFAAERPVAPLSYERSACAAPIAELACIIAQEGLEQPRLYAMTVAALDALAEADGRSSLAITGACIMKMLATAGFRPSLDACVSCGRELDLASLGQWASLSFADGGIVCNACPRLGDAVPVESTTLAWVKALLYTRFSDIADLEPDDHALFEVLQFARQWTRTHTGRDLRSLDFLFTSGVF